MNYDYIIAGGGCAGLSLAWHLIMYGPANKKTLLIDNDLTISDTKTLCYWGAGNIPYQDLIYKTWEKMQVNIKGAAINGDLKHSPYHCLRESDFKKYVLSFIQDSNAIDVIESDIHEIRPGKRPIVKCTDGSFQAKFIFQSCFLNKDSYKKSRFNLKQHFLGWEINSYKSCFDPDRITLMDFNTPQDNGVTFYYLLPFSSRHALIEYTLFSSNILDKQEYEHAVLNYISNQLKLHPYDYEVIRTEQGIIPMVESSHQPLNGEGVINIGISSGIAKPSTGYTFARIQRQCQQIIKTLLKSNQPDIKPASSYRFRIYDIIFLHIIKHHPEEAIEAFYQLFNKNKFDNILRFLDEQTTLAEELRIFTTVPYHSFLRAIYKTKGLILSRAR